jgi:hypothetical protein
LESHTDLAGSSSRPAAREAEERIDEEHGKDFRLRCNVNHYVQKALDSYTFRERLSVLVVLMEHCVTSPVFNTWGQTREQGGAARDKIRRKVYTRYEMR